MKKLASLVFVALLLMLSISSAYGSTENEKYYDQLLTKYSSPYRETVNAASSTSPYSSYFKNNDERVITSSGSLNITATDLVLRGRNGFDLVIKRIYDSDLAQEQGYAKYDFVLLDSEGTHPIPAPAYINPHSPTVSTFSRGWTLNIPWVETIADVGTFIHLPEGQYVKVTNPDVNFEYHDGIHFTYFNKVLTFANGTKYTFDSNGKAKTFTDPRCDGAIITYNYTYNSNGSLLTSIIDSVGRVVSFNYAKKEVRTKVSYGFWSTTIGYDVYVITSITVGSKTITYTYDGDRLYQVIDPKQRVTTYGYGQHSLMKGTNIKWQSVHDFKYYLYDGNYPYNPAQNAEVTSDSLQPGMETLPSNTDYYSKCNAYALYFDVLQTITYPSKAVSTYTYDPRESKNTSSWVRYPASPKYYEVFTPISNTNFYKYAKVYDLVDTYTWGSKLVVKNHTCENQTTTYAFTMNGSTHSIWDDNAILPNSYVKSASIVKDNQLTVETFRQVCGSSSFTDMVYSWNYSGFYSSSPAKKYRGCILTSRTIYNKDASSGGYVEFETTNYGYNLANKTLTSETRSRNGATVCSDTYTNDDWGNVTSHSNSVTKIDETMTYFTNDTFRNLLQSHIVKNYDPATDSYSQVTTIYGDYLIGKPTQVTVSSTVGDLVTKFEYYPNGNLQKTTGSNGLVTELTYDAEKAAFPARIQTSGIVDPDGNVATYATRFGYDIGTGLKTWEMDGRGYTTYYVYDVLDRVTKVVLPDDDDTAFAEPNAGSYPTSNLYREYVYNDDANTCEVWNENRKKTLYAYDGLGRITAITQYNDGFRYSSGESKTILSYNNLGQLESVTNPNTYTTRYQYDGLNRLTKIIYPTEISGDESVYASLSYDDATNTVTVRQENGNTIVHQKDWADRLIQATQKAVFGSEADTYDWSFQYDSLGNRVQQINPLTKVTNYTYDPLSHLTKMALPAESLVNVGSSTKTEVNNLVEQRPTKSSEYDVFGNKISDTDANGNKTTYGYDALGRLIWTKAQTTQTNVATKSAETVTATAQYFYDANGNQVMKVDPNGHKWLYTYSARGFLLSETDPLGNKTQYRYDPLGNKIATIDPRNTAESPAIWYSISGDALTLNDPRSDKTYTTWYLYDDYNRLYRTVLPASTAPINPFESTPSYDNPYQESWYDLEGNKLTERDPNGVKTTYSYYPRSWVHTKAGPDSKEEYEYDAVGNQTKINIWTDISAGTYYTITKNYDSLSRLRQVVNPQGEESYTYDALGNQTIGVIDNSSAPCISGYFRQTVR